MKRSSEYWPFWTNSAGAVIPGEHGPIPVGQGIGVPVPGIIVGQGIGVPIPGIIVGQGIGVPMPGVPVGPGEADPNATPAMLAEAPLQAASRTTSMPRRPKRIQCCLRRRLGIALTIFSGSPL